MCHDAPGNTERDEGWDVLRHSIDEHYRQVLLVSRWYLVDDEYWWICRRGPTSMSWRSSGSSWLSWGTFEEWGETGRALGWGLKDLRVLIFTVFWVTSPDSALFCRRVGKVWDQVVQFVHVPSLAVRESPWDDLGFSPLEFVYGHEVGRPLKTYWKSVG